MRDRANVARRGGVATLWLFIAPVVTVVLLHVWVISGPPFIELDASTVASAARLKIENDSDETRHYTITVRESDLKLRLPRVGWDVKAGESLDIPLFIDVPRATFVKGKRKTAIYIDDSAGFHRVVAVALIGPEGQRR